MAGLTPMFGDADLLRWNLKFQRNATEKIIEALTYAGEYFVKLARENGAYNDITGNLRSSIEYVVIVDGDVVSDDFQGVANGPDGVINARRLATKLAQVHSKGFVLIGMAGMDYAMKVEQINGKDVIASSQVKTNDLLVKLLKKAIDG